MFTKRFTRPFHQLRGKLTLSYTLTLVVTFLFVEVIGIGITLLVASMNAPSYIGNSLRQDAPRAAPYFIHGSPDREELTAELRLINADLPSKEGPFSAHAIFLSIVDMQGHTIASVGTSPIPAGPLIQTQLSPGNRANLRAVLNDAKGTTNTIDQDADGTLMAITPIVGQRGHVQAALVIKVAQPDRRQLLSGFLAFVTVTGTIITVIAAIAGMLSGYLTARGLTRRLTGLSVAADRWSRGDFSALTHDTSQDELGQVARQLNTMATQLQNLLQVRQKLAALEERNRLARDLHDSVKQQIFVVAMQIGATKVLLKRDVAAAEVRLNEAEKLVHQAQQELTSLIREMRPAALEGQGLTAALRELATRWTQQTGIVANLRIDNPDATEGARTLSLMVEEALYRVAQEALANVARHSQASLVQMILTTTDDAVTLSVSDNGQGFDTTRQGHAGVGLLSMQERMKALGGDMQVESAPEKGAHLVAHCQRLGTATSATAPASGTEFSLSP